MGDGGKAHALSEPDGRATVALDELVEAFERVLEGVETCGCTAERTGDHEGVSRDGPCAAGNSLAPPHGYDAQCHVFRRNRVAAEHRGAGLVQAFVELRNLLMLDRARKAEAHEQAERLGAHGGQIAQVDGGRLVAEVVPGGPLEPEVDTFDEQVLRDDEAAVEDRSLRVLPRDEPSALELREERELTEL
jgi:hypothetical protein